MSVTEDSTKGYTHKMLDTKPLKGGFIEVICETEEFLAKPASTSLLSC